MVREKLEYCLTDICGTMRQVFAWLVWWDVCKEEYEDSSWSPKKADYLGVIKLACYEATLSNTRKLHEFFNSDNRRSDDIRATHFCDFPSKILLKPDQIKELHKRIAHQTNINTKYDVTFNMTFAQTNTGNLCIEFLEHIITNFKPHSEYVRSQIFNTRSFMLDCIERVQEIEREQNNDYY